MRLIRALVACTIVGLSQAALVMALYVLLHRHRWVVCGVGAYLVLINFLTYAEFRGDKVAATRRAARTPEDRLLGMCLIGGALGGVVASHAYRHKTSKLSFRAKFWSSIAAQAIISYAALFNVPLDAWIGARGTSWLTGARQAPPPSDMQQPIVSFSAPAVTPAPSSQPARATVGKATTASVVLDDSGAKPAKKPRQRARSR